MTGPALAGGPPDAHAQRRIPAHWFLAALLGLLVLLAAPPARADASQVAGHGRGQTAELPDEDGGVGSGDPDVHHPKEAQESDNSVGTWLLVAGALAVTLLVGAAVVKILGRDHDGER